jgi:uncharacterized protein YaaW (UPF0174 family)
VTTNHHINSLLDAIANRNCEKSYKELFVLLHEQQTVFAASILKSTKYAKEVVSDFFMHIWQKRIELAALEKPDFIFYRGKKYCAQWALVQ